MSTLVSRQTQINWNRLGAHITQYSNPLKLWFIGLHSNINNPIYNGPILWTKVHVGWEKVLEHDWGYSKDFNIPNIDNLQWTDVLDTKLLIMDL